MTTTEALQFRCYYSSYPVLLRTLTELDFAAMGGMVQTSDGPKPFLPGDALRKDGVETWPLSVSLVRAKYIRRNVIDSEGWTRYLSPDIYEAAQLAEAMTVDRITGGPGDYLVRREGRSWIISKALFEECYELVEMPTESEITQ